MASPPILDLESLLAPIPGDSPVGVDLREDENSAYYALRTLRLECGDEERQVDAGNAEAGPATRWEELASGCEAALREKTKDLQIACWLLEAQARIHRDPPLSEFAALRDGFKLLNELCTRYWDTMFSIPDDDPEAKGQPLVALNEGALITPLRKIPLSLREAPGPYAFWQIELARKKGAMAEIDALFRKGARAFYEPLLTDIADAQRELAALDETVRPRNVNLANVREAIEGIQTLVQHVSGNKLGDGAAAAPQAEGAGAAGAAAGGAARRADGPFGSREEALEALLAIARYFREREPQATISYTIEDAVRRARMSLADLLLELMDEDARRKMLLNAGILPPKSE